MGKGHLQVRIRLDFKGEAQPRFFFGGKNGEKAAEEIREQKATLLRNVPYQGIVIEEIDLSPEVYQVYDVSMDEQVFYAPLIITLWAASVEDLIRFIIKQEFRKIEILQPDEITLSGQSLEKLLFKIAEEIKLDRLALEVRHRR
ncbi:MAG: hypothetical protein GX750_03010 [Clostridia bacterium]|nr:hypothetical protein [Clostridia bacterium]